MAKIKRKIENIVPIIKAGMASDFWRVICQNLDVNIEALQSEIQSDTLRDLSPGAYKHRVELLKARMKYLAKLKELPELLIQNNGILEGEDEDLDPYDKPEREE